MKLAQFLNQISFKISEMWIVKAIRRGLMYAMPFILVGSMALLILNLPIDQFQALLNTDAGMKVKDFLLLLYKGTFEIMAVGVLLSISYALISESKTVGREGIPHILILLVVLGCYFIFIANTDNLLPAKSAGATGLFTAILVSVVITNLFIFLYEKRIFMGDLHADSYDMVLYQTLKVLLPALITLSFAAIIKGLMLYLHINFLNFTFIVNFMQKTYGLFSAVLFDMVSHLMWFIGIHGNNILEAVNIDVFSAASSVNVGLIQNGLPPTEIFTKQFMDIFVFIGGSGTTLSLIIALLLKGRKSNSYRLAKISFIPGVFNINELVVYGLPIVLNPVFLLPFILTPIVLTFTAYAAMAFGLVPLTIRNDVAWTAPIIMGGYVATGSFAGSVLQIANVGIGVLIYMPFVNLYEKYKLDINKALLHNFISQALRSSTDMANPLFTKQGDIGSLARTLTRDIKAALVDGKNTFHMEYQPQVDTDSKVMGVESLLRWNHPVFEKIPPPVIVRLAEEGGMTNELGNWVIHESLLALKGWNEAGLHNIILSLNLSAEQIKDGKFVSAIKEQFKLTGVNPSDVEFELTENAAIDQSKDTKIALLELQSMGSRIAIDDFGMGHSSLLYIKDFKVDTVKLDGSLVKDLVKDMSSQEIVTSICNLCDMLNLNVIAEYVETKEQKEVLEKIGCDCYQGYLYSQSLVNSDFIKYVKEKGISKQEEEIVLA